MKEPFLPLHQLQAFHAAARHLSFSRAAQELNVLGPAIGRQVALLEEDLSVRLFLRTKPRLTLTEEGAFLARITADGFGALQDGLMQLRQRSLPAPIVVNAAIGFTSFYLLPRMADFQARHPEIEVQIVTRDPDPDYDPAACDIVVTFGPAGLSGSPSAMIIPERLVAICAPSVLADTRPLTREALCRERLLHMTGDNHFDDWSRFFEGCDAEAAKPPRHDRFHSFMVYSRAIQNGMGIGLGWRPFVDDMLDAGLLTLASSHECKTNRGYYCSLTRRGMAKPDASLVLNWLCRTESSAEGTTS